MGLKNGQEGEASSATRSVAPWRSVPRETSPSRNVQGVATSSRTGGKLEQNPANTRVRGIHALDENRSTPAGSVSVTVLTLDNHTFLFPPPGDQQSYQSRTEDRNEDDYELKFVKDFYVRRKYGRRFGLADRSHENKTFLEFGLLGTKYFHGGDSNVQPVASNVPLPEVGVGNKDSNTLLQPGQTRSHLSKTAQGGALEESNFKTLSSFWSMSLPGVSSSPPNKSMKSKDLLPMGRLFGSSSLLAGDFGFNTVRSDTFSGHKRFQAPVLEGLEKGAAGDSQLLKELERQAKRQIFACQNTGYFRRGSRAAQSVLNFRHSVFPHHVEPSVSRFILPEGRGYSRGKAGTPPASGTGEDERRKRLAHPAPGARLTTPRIPDRQEEASRRAALPSISGSSLSVVPTQNTAK